MYINFNKEYDKKGPKFGVGDHVRISKYKNIFPKGYVPSCSEKVFWLKKVKSTVSWTYVISDFNGQEFVGTFFLKKIAKCKSKRA